MSIATEIIDGLNELADTLEEKAVITDAQLDEWAKLAEQAVPAARTAVPALVAEVRRLRGKLDLERIDTHSAECWSFGPKHYECALQEVRRLRARGPKAIEWQHDKQGGCHGSVGSVLNYAVIRHEGNQWSAEFEDWPFGPYHDTADDAKADCERHWRQTWEAMTESDAKGAES